MSGLHALEVRGVSLRFGGVRALTEVSFGVRDGELFSIIGPNGAGKTSIVNCISGRYKPTEGQLFYRGQDITTLNTNARPRLGIGRTFQNLALFHHMSVLDNIMVGRQAGQGAGRRRDRRGKLVADGETVEFHPLLVVDDDGKTHVGAEAAKAVVTAKPLGEKKGEKVKVSSTGPSRVREEGGAPPTRDDARDHRGEAPGRRASTQKKDDQKDGADAAAASDSW